MQAGADEGIVVNEINSSSSMNLSKNIELIDRTCFSLDALERFLFIFFLACERAEFSKSCNLIGSGSGRKFSILPAHGAIPPG